MKVYCFSGLGADKRAFQYLEIKNHELVHIPWMENLPGETLEAHALRYMDQIDTTRSFCLMGLSFGGMVSTEIAKRTSPKKVILISSAGSRKQLPRYFRFAGKLGIVSILPDFVLDKPNFVSRWLFSGQTPRTRELLNHFLGDSEPKYLKWAIKAIFNWQNNEPVECTRIHGTKDRLMPARGQQIDYWIKGGHLVIVDKPEELSDIINKELAL